MGSLTVKTRIVADAASEALLRKTLRLYTESFNRVCAVGFPEKRINGVELHHATYYAERTATELPAQLVCSARVKATEALASGRKLQQKLNTKAAAKGKEPKILRCPRSTRCAIRYDARSSKIDLRGGTAGLTVLGPRVHVRLLVPPHHTARLGWKVESSDLVVDRKGRLWLHVSVEIPERAFAPSGEVLGVDLGVVRPAVTSNATFLGQRRWRDIDARAFKLKRALQAKGTRSAKRHLRRLSGRVNRFRRDCDHVLSRQILDSVGPGAVVVLEDLTDIRMGAKRHKGEQRRRLHSWSFDRLHGFLAYKGELAGVDIALVSPRFTSQKCSACGHRDKANRVSQSEFRCKKCGLHLNADLNAARNIRADYLASEAKRAAGGRIVNAPIVAGVQPQGSSSSCKPSLSSDGS